MSRLRPKANLSLQKRGSFLDAEEAEGTFFATKDGLGIKTTAIISNAQYCLFGLNL